jgi:hypothetical protein
MTYATIADSLSPEILAELAQSYGLDIDALDYCDGAFINRRASLGHSMALWHRLRR